MPLFVFGLAVTIGVVVVVRVFVTADPRLLAQFLRLTAGAAVGGGVLALILAGREGLLLSLGVLALPLMWRHGDWRRWWHWFALGGRRGPARGRTSQIETGLLRMTLDHDSGRLWGQVLNGPYQGRTLDRLTLDEVLGLLEETRRLDGQSATLLETWLDRAHGADWRKREKERRNTESPTDARGRMTREEALAVLGLTRDAPPDAVKEAHRRLMAKVHPDHGGSTWIAAKLNQARDVLMNP